MRCRKNRFMTNSNDKIKTKLEMKMEVDRLKLRLTGQGPILCTFSRCLIEKKMKSYPMVIFINKLNIC